MKNCNGNILDADIIKQLKSLSEDHSDFFRQLERSKRVLMGDRQEYDNEIAQLKSKVSENDDEIKGLVSALGKASDTPTEDYIMEQINGLHNKGQSLKRRLAELEELTSSNAWSEIEFDLLAQMLATFKNTVDEMTVEQKRAAIRAIVKQIIWDGKEAHVVLFGSDYEYEFPEIPVGIGQIMSKNGEKENFDVAAEGGNAEPLREYSK